MTPVDPAWLRQIADEIDEGAETVPCSQAGVCRDAATEIERLRAALAAAIVIPDVLAWKRNFLALETTIEEFQNKHLQKVAQFRPPADTPSQGNVIRLLDRHLHRCRELLWAEVQGNLDGDYQEEIDKLL